MREILFKAKRIDNGEWVEGYVFDDGFVDSKRMFVGGLVIMDYKGTANDRWKVGTAFYEVDPNTICQYTGLTDKNGNKIWENDVCRYVNSDVYEKQEEILVVKYGRHAESCKINIGFYIDWIKADYYRSDLVFWAENRNIEAIGNIFDNPELIEECD